MTIRTRPDSTNNSLYSSHVDLRLGIIQYNNSLAIKIWIRKIKKNKIDVDDRHIIKLSEI